jgi:hypothetical protein
MLREMFSLLSIKVSERKRLPPSEAGRMSFEIIELYRSYNYALNIILISCVRLCSA